MSFISFLIGTVAVVSAICVVGLRNPLFSAFALVVNLLAMAGLYAALDAHFLAVSQVVVYAGAIMVLVLFVLMLLNLKAESGRKLGFLRSAFALMIGVGVVISALPPVLSHFSGMSPTTLSDNMNSSVGTVKAIGQELYTNYVAQFELASLVLLIGIVGAVMLSKRKSVTLAPRPGGLIGGSK
jgi:NADH-quinone oxidoreductase subunit J